MPTTPPPPPPPFLLHLLRSKPRPPPPLPSLPPCAFLPSVSLGQFRAKDATARCRGARLYPPLFLRPGNENSSRKIERPGPSVSREDGCVRQGKATGRQDSTTTRQTLFLRPKRQGQQDKTGQPQDKTRQDRTTTRQDKTRQDKTTTRQG